ncbi:VOC family protein [Xanthomonas prunicola]|uniref:VOC family protein n=1 Tax=Xanthomonas prunicola TaxID=2053930 RepID=UPI0021B458A7|nr:VOC family protein [Xanthomonas prunicola]UXA68165.1 VOC family protein [Xanthomonas prunicola]
MGIAPSAPRIPSQHSRQASTMTTGILGIHHVGIVVQDLEASARWYADQLGFRRLHAFGFPGAKVVFVGLDNLRLELIQTEDAMPMAAERAERQSNIRLGGINHLAIAVDDLDRTIDRLQANGVEIAAPPSAVPNSGGDRFAFIRDNERMLIELFQSAA